MLIKATDPDEVQSNVETSQTYETMCISADFFLTFSLMLTVPCTQLLINHA